MKLTDTIAAVSTPYGKGGIALIRISGADAVAIGEKVFFPKSGKRLGELAHGAMTYGEIRRPNGEDLDDGMAVCFYAPRSFTGENTVEITCHGGILITEQVLGAVLSAGARAADPGEFTRRAYIFGKMKLTEAEALGNLLEAGTQSQLSLARSGMKGHLAERTEGIYLSLRSVLSSLYAAIDFPDEDLSELTREEIIDQVSRAKADTERLSATYGTGKAIMEGIPTVICGRTNAGKSSVYNRILGYEAAIVTDIEGTTRDVLRQTATMGKTTLCLCDTAGLRDTEDRVESIGIKKTREEMRQAGLILAVFDTSKPLSNEDLDLCEEIKKAQIPAIALLNKTDLKEAFDLSKITQFFSKYVKISAQSGIGFEELARVIDSLFIDGDLNVGQDAIVTGARQYASLKQAEEAMDASLADLQAGLPMDLCSVGIEQALSALGEIDGRELGEEIVAEIFSRFCVGK